MEVGNFFFTKEKKPFLYIHPMTCAPKLLRPLIAVWCTPIAASTCPAPLVQNATVASEEQLPLSHHGRGCVPQQGSTSPACLLLPGSQRGALPVHTRRSSSAFSCPLHTNKHVGPSGGPQPLSQQGPPSRRAEDRGCHRKEKEAAMLEGGREERTETEQGGGMLKRWGMGEDAALQVVQRCNAGDTMK